MVYWKRELKILETFKIGKKKDVRMRAQTRKKMNNY